MRWYLCALLAVAMMVPDNSAQPIFDDLVAEHAQTRNSSEYPKFLMYDEHDPRWIFVQYYEENILDSGEVESKWVQGWKEILSYEQVAGNRAALELKRENETAKWAQWLAAHHCWGFDEPGLSKKN